MFNIPHANRATAFLDYSQSIDAWKIAKDVGDYETANKLRNRIFVLETDLNVQPHTVLPKLEPSVVNAEQLELKKALAEKRAKDAVTMGQLNMVPFSSLPKDAQDSIRYNAKYNGYPPPVEDVSPWERENYHLPVILTNAYDLLNVAMTNTVKYATLGGKIIDTGGKAAEGAGKVVDKVNDILDKPLPSLDFTGPALLIGAVALASVVVIKHI